MISIKLACQLVFISFNLCNLDIKPKVFLQQPSGEILHFNILLFLYCIFNMKLQTFVPSHAHHSIQYLSSTFLPLGATDSHSLAL